MSNKTLSPKLCSFCGKELECHKYQHKYQTGTIYYLQKCPWCGKHNHSKKCIGCNMPLGTKTAKAKYCDDCYAVNLNDRSKTYLHNPNPVAHTILHNPNPLAHTIAALRWQSRNRLKQRASKFARYHQNDLNILYECACLGDSKHNHHPDYNKPFEVIKLCHKCHRLEHERLNSIDQI